MAVVQSSKPAFAPTRSARVEVSLAGQPARASGNNNYNNFAGRENAVIATTSTRRNRHSPTFFCSSSNVQQQSAPENDAIVSSLSSFPPQERSFPHGKDPPHLALITMRCSCDSDAQTERALRQLQQAVTTTCHGYGVDLVSVRVNAVPATTASSDDPNYRHAVEQRLTRMVQQLVAWSQQQEQQQQSTGASAFRVVVSSDWLEVGLRAGAHGVHFKESHRDRIPHARALFRELHAANNNDNNMLVGTSTHTVESALDAMERYQPDYFFCGTCFETESHPEKMGDDLEGPALPAQVAQALRQQQHYQQQQQQSIHDIDFEAPPPPVVPKVLAIGGLNASNCREQCTRGFYVKNSRADGIATIRAVLEADRPDDAVREICANLRQGTEEH